MKVIIVRFMETMLFVTTFGTIFFSQTPVSTNKTETEILKRQVSLYEFHYSETPSIVQGALVKAHLPGGIVTTNCDENRMRYVFTRPRISLGDLLLNVEQIDPQYAWEFGDGVLNLFPRQEIPDLLKLNFTVFKVHAVTSYEALNALRKSPETKRKMSDLGLDKAVSSISIPSYYDPDHNYPETALRFDLNLQNATFRQILNEIVKKDGNIIWYYAESKCNGESLFNLFLVG